MNLPDLLRKRGIDPEDFLIRAKAHRDLQSYTWPQLRAGKRDIGSYRRGYVNSVFYWEYQPEKYAFWETLDSEWRYADVKDRWLELEAAMGWLDPLEAELMEVKDEST